jgi:hypothetical protein
MAPGWPPHGFGSNRVADLGPNHFDRQDPRNVAKRLTRTLDTRRAVSVVGVGQDEPHSARELGY